MSSEASNSADTATAPSTKAPHFALELNDILEEIFSHLGSPRELLQYRLVCQQWNDVIVHVLVTKLKNSFPLHLRYGPQVHRSLLPAEAEARTKEILETPTITLTGTTIPLSFDTVVVEHDFYLAGVNPEWQNFLQDYGDSIRHLKFNIRSGEGPEENSHHVQDCAVVVSLENLKAIFSSTPNLESLDFSVRFTDYGGQENRHGPHRMFPEAHEVSDLPQMTRLTKITIQEPHGNSYLKCFLKELLAMAPNLNTLYIKLDKKLESFVTVMKVDSLPNLQETLTTLGITMVDRNAWFKESEFRGSGFTRFHLTKLELDRIIGNGRHLEEFLYSQSPTLTTLILGDRDSVEPDQIKLYPHYDPGFDLQNLWAQVHKCRTLYRDRVALPPLMASLKVFEVNLPKFTLGRITDYSTQFPVLEELTFSNCEDTECLWKYVEMMHVLPGEIGHSHSVKKFSLVGLIRDEDRNNIIEAISSTFPFADHHFGL